MTPPISPPLIVRLGGGQLDEGTFALYESIVCSDCSRYPGQLEPSIRPP